MAYTYDILSCQTAEGRGGGGRGEAAFVLYCIAAGGFQTVVHNVEAGKWSACSGRLMWRYLHRDTLPYTRTHDRMLHKLRAPKVDSRQNARGIMIRGRRKKSVWKVDDFPRGPIVPVRM